MKTVLYSHEVHKDLSVLCHHADLDTYFKSIVKSYFSCNCQDSHMLF